MLFQVGPLQIRVAPFNVDTVSETVGGDYAVKPVLGRRPPREAVGESEAPLKLSGTLFPFRIGGFDELETAKDLARSQKPVFVFRGDGTPLGWHTIEKVTADHSRLETNGVGQEIPFSLELQATDAPAADGFFDSLTSLLP